MTADPARAAPRSWRASAAALAGFLAAAAIVAAIGAMATASSLAGWYPTLRKPSFNPPNWVFGPVWSLLYVMMSLAAWRVWARPDATPGRAAALRLYGLQLALNLAWSPLFFGLHRPDLALVDIAALFATLGATAWAFVRQSAMAGLLLVPYVAWVGFATCLNYAIWWLN